MNYILILLTITLSLFGLEKVSLQLSWLNQFQFAGFYIAKEKGFYQDVGLELSLKEFNNSVNIVDSVVSGNSNFGISKSSLLIDRIKGEPVVALTAIFQTSPFVLLTTDKNIKKPSDLKGKRVMITNDISKSASITAMLRANKVSKDDFLIQQHSFNYRDLVLGKIDAMATYISNEPYYLEKMGIDYNVLDPKEYGFNFYGDILFTSENELSNHKHRVKSFVEATKKGWLWAFNNIEESAKIIFEKYNTQNKSLKSLIFEGEALKKLAFDKHGNFGQISGEKFKNIAQVYQLTGILNQRDYTLRGFIDPNYYSREVLKIGVLAKRGYEKTIERWQPLADYINSKQYLYNVRIVPLNFEELENSVHNRDVDFVITNSIYYISLEVHDGVVRIATLMNRGSIENHNLTKFGGVIFTRSDNSEINSIKDLDGKKLGAVNTSSFGGWIMAYSELFSNKISIDDIDLNFLNTHDGVVYSVLNGDVDAGTVRTDTLERMAKEKLIDISKIKIINQKIVDDFPYLLSTALYPEWPFAKLKHTSEYAANLMMSILIQIEPDSSVAKKTNINGWTTPLDYTAVHQVLKKLKIDPYDNEEITIREVIDEYLEWILIIATLFIVLVVKLILEMKMEQYLKIYNKKLEDEVIERTKYLEEANVKLRKIARTDSLTGIFNRGYFMDLAEECFAVAKRENKPLQVMTLDIDFFKKVNDTYGHHSGDVVLIEFAKSVQNNLRGNDLLGRTGGEEFIVIFQDISSEQALNCAERIRKSVENLEICVDTYNINITVSIGIAQLNKDKTLGEIIKRSDEALYEAKERGRNRVVLRN